MKKLLLTLGSIAAVAAPVASVVACGAPAKPAPKVINEAAAKKLAVKIVATLTHGSNEVPTVKMLTDGNIAISFHIPAPKDVKPAPIIIVITPTGDVVSSLEDGKVSPPEEIEQLEKMVKAATENHDNDSLEKFVIDPVRYGDAGVISSAGITMPADITETDYDSVNTYNDAVEAFMNAFDKEVAIEILGLMNSKMELTITADAYHQISFSSKELDAALITTLGIPNNIAPKLNRLLTIGGKVILFKSSGDDDLSGTVVGTGDDSASGINWDSTQITFATS